MPTRSVKAISSRMRGLAVVTDRYRRIELLTPCEVIKRTRRFPLLASQDCKRSFTLVAVKRSQRFIHVMQGLVPGTRLARDLLIVMRRQPAQGRRQMRADRSSLAGARARDRPRRDPRQLSHARGAARRRQACAAVVKADAYGLGAAQVAPALAAAGARQFFVAHLDEAIALRPLLPAAAEVFVLNGLPAGRRARLPPRRGIIPVLNSLGQLDAWTALAGRRARPASCRRCCRSTAACRARPVGAELDAARRRSGPARRHRLRLW